MNYYIGDVLVHKGMPLRNNPYCGCGRDGNPKTSLSGKERITALRAFRDGKPTTDYTFWYAPYNGGACQISSPDEIDWSHLRE